MQSSLGNLSCVYLNSFIAFKRHFGHPWYEKSKFKQTQVKKHQILIASPLLFW